MADQGQRSAEAMLNQLMMKHRVTTHHDLAIVLGVGRSTVTSWLRRGNVPLVYTSIPASPPLNALGTVAAAIALLDDQALPDAVARKAVRSLLAQLEAAHG